MIRRTFASACVLAALFASSSARADCPTDAEQGQRTRDEGRLLDGRASFVRCAADSCPAVVRRECLQWLGEIDERIPTIVVSARSSTGKDVVAAEITLDGRPVPATSLGRELQIDPGPHQLRATAPRHATVTESIVVREREKGRGVVLVLAESGARPDGGAGPVQARPARTVPTLSWVLGGVAIAGGAGFGYFWARGMGEVRDMRDSCAPYCTGDRIDDARVPLNVARVSLGIGIAAAAAAIVVYFLQPGTRPSGAARKVPSLTFEL